jgi:hypothetical protein
MHDRFDSIESKLFAKERKQNTSYGFGEFELKKYDWIII